MTPALNVIYDPWFWVIWILWAIIALAVWQTLRARTRRADEAKSKEEKRRQAEEQWRRQIHQDSLVEYTTRNSHYLMLEAELARSNDVSLITDIQDFGWAIDQARQVGIADIPSLDEAAQANYKLILRLASKFHWHSFHRGDALWLLFQLMGTSLGSDGYARFAKGLTHTLALPDDIARAVRHIREEEDVWQTAGT